MTRVFTAVFLMFAFAACATKAPGDNGAAQTSLPESSLEKIADGVWIHKSYALVEPWGPILSQGLVVKTAGGVFLVDTAWNDADTEKLLTLIKSETGEAPKAAIVTHAHRDKMGGVSALRRHGVISFAHVFSNEDAPGRNLTPADNDLFAPATDAVGKLLFQLERGPAGGGYTIAPEGAFGSDAQAAGQTIGEVTVYYPGPGHTRDNIVVYYAPAKVLFGGCLIRPGAANDLGNTADGDVGHWAQAVRNVAEAFPDAEIVVPSHGPMGGRELLDHTIALAEAAAHE